MEVKQLSALLNKIGDELLGKSDIVTEDLQGVVELGQAILNGSSTDNYVKSLVNHIGKMVFVDRPYYGELLSVLKDNWEFGSIVEKVRMDVASVAETENESWDLKNGTSYDPNIFYKPTITVKFFNNKTAFEIPVSITEMQVKESFSNSTQVNSFVSMIYSAIEKRLNMDVDALIKRTITNFIGETLHADYPDNNYGAKSGVKAVNLLFLYNKEKKQQLKAAEAITDPEFLRYASMKMANYIDRLGTMSTLFNIGGKSNQTPKDKLHVVLLSEFIKGAQFYLQSDTWHNELTKLPLAETVTFWQGSGVDYTFDKTSAIHVNTASNNEIVASGILGVMFDHEALGVSLFNKRVTTNYNAKAEFINNFYKCEGRYFNDLDENFVVFFIADAA